MCGKVQKSRLTEITRFIFTSALWGFFTTLLLHQPNSSAVTMESDWWLHDNRHCSSGTLLSSEIHILGLESLMAVTSLFIYMAGNAPFISAVRAVCVPGGSRGTNILFHLVTFRSCLHSWAHGHTCPSSKPAMEGQFLFTMNDLSDPLLYFLLLLVRTLVITLVPTRYSGIISLFEGQLINILNSSVTFISLCPIT